jgi:hypothetical protein
MNVEPQLASRREYVGNSVQCLSRCEFGLRVGNVVELSELVLMMKSTGRLHYIFRLDMSRGG